MKKGLFLVFHGFAAHNGISKKIFSQVEALRDCGVDMRLSYLDRRPDGSWRRMAGGEVVEDFGRGIRGKIGKRVRYGSLARYIRDEGIGFVYIRNDHNANPFLVHWLGRIERMGVKTVMEIPTYPYDNEYLRSPRKRKLRLALDKMFRRAMARRIGRIVTFAEQDEIFGRPTIRISNGIDFDRIPVKEPEKDPSRSLRLIGVADIHFWHGFDRVIRGLAEYYRRPADTPVVFHIVGGGVPSEMQGLRELTAEAGLEDKVLFHGPKSGEELDRMFDEADMGIASLGRHRCGIDRIKTLKNREYAARGIPFVYSETDPDFDAMPYVMKAPADESPLDIAQVVDFYRRQNLSPRQIRATVRELSWQSQMQRVLDAVYPEGINHKES